MEEQGYHKNPLVKEIPTHLFQFEEKIFGMTLLQLLSDIAACAIIFTLTSSFSLAARLTVSLLLLIPALVLVHAKVRGQSLLHWIYLYVRFFMIPRYTTWQSPAETQKQGKRRRRKPLPVQDAWIQLDTLEGTIMGYSEPEKRKGRARGRYWVIYEVEGRNIRYLPEHEQVQAFQTFETFLTGLDFRLQFLTHIEQVHPDAFQPLIQQQLRLKQSAQKSPRLAALLRASIGYQRRKLSSCTHTRYFVVVSVSAQEEITRLRDVTGSRQTPLAVLSERFLFKRQQTVTREQILDQLRIRTSRLKKLFQQLEVRAWPLADSDLLKAFASSVALGADIPSFQPEVDGEVATAALIQLASKQQEHATQDVATTEKTASGKGHSTENHAAARKKHGKLYKKRLRGLHKSVSYLSRNSQARFEQGAARLADLVAPTSIEVLPNALAIEVAGRKRYQRSFILTGYGREEPCGWPGDFTEMGLPMLISSQFEPIDTQFMISKLEGQLVRLESQRHSNEKKLRITHAHESEEVAQIRRVVQLLAGHRMKIFAATMLLTIHASSLERLEQRSNYLLSYLRAAQLQVQPATRRHDETWLLSHPACQQAPLDMACNLPSDALSTFLPFVHGVVGTPNGIFLGFIGTGASRRPVYIDPWSLVNPHMVIIGETGRGKSWAGKTIAVGLAGQGIADVVVLDKDDDYLPLHQALGEESQRFDLARGCPINVFDIPYGPQDVNPDDPDDLFSEFLNNALITGLTLLVTDSEQELSKIEEAFMLQVARATYAKRGITSESIMANPSTLLRPMPTLSDYLATMRETPSADKAKKQSLIERFERASYLFSGQTSVSIDKPLTVFSIHNLAEKWYPLMTYIVQNFIMRHRSLRRDERYLAYFVEEASYMLRHPAGRKYLETGSRGFRKLGIAQFTLSQEPREFLEEGQVVLNNAGTAIYLGMKENAVAKLNLSPELEHMLKMAEPGQAIMRCKNEYASITIASIPEYRAIFTTDERERREIRKKQEGGAARNAEQEKLAS
jgi:Helicase HerA, central domain